MHLDGIKKGNFERIKTYALSTVLNEAKRRFGEVFCIERQSVPIGQFPYQLNFTEVESVSPPPRNIEITCKGKKIRGPVNILTGAEKKPYSSPSGKLKANVIFFGTIYASERICSQHGS